MYNSIGKCGFCGLIKPLLESHIISKFTFNSVKREEKDIVNVSLTSKEINISQDGPKEYLFCADCEKKRNPFETYFSLINYKNVFIKPYRRYLVQGLDYSKLKLFIMWNIYAYHVCTLKNYNQFDLYLDDLKDMLNTNDPGSISEYGFCIWRLKDKVVNTKNMVLLPIVKKVGSHFGIDFIICGLFFRCLAHGNADKTLLSHFLQTDGSIVVEQKSLRMALRLSGQNV
jgi:hypothetical protein